MMRPQRASLAMSTIGAKVHLMPTELASLAAMLLRMFRCGRIPRGSERERDGIDSSEAVNYVVAED